ncbi:MAG: ATP-dependent helicase [Nitrospirae bacterium]|nr:ATP-dependent helicase [Nitrospirota bacterium]
MGQRGGTRSLLKYTIKRQETEKTFLIDYQEALNSAQFEVVTSLSGPLLVVAGAGSGKTRTLIYRLARLIETGVSPKNILLLTFTRRAAQEMLRRASLLMDDRCERISGGTFHSVANTVLRQHGGLIGIESSFTILDRSDSEEIIHLLRNTLGLAEKKRRFPRKNTILDMISASQNKNLSLEDIVLRDYDHFSHEIDSLIQLKELYARYKEQKQLVDYDDLLIKWLELLKKFPELRDRLSMEYQYIMVDEYQDTNLAQAELIKELAAIHRNVMVVGDDAQSIYSFRGASFQNMFDFQRDFPECRTLTLEENYRSHQKILDLANHTNEKARMKHGKQLFSRKTEGMTPVLIQAPDENMQSKFICQKILELRELDIPLEEMAVLFRSGSHSFDLEIEMARYHIPFIKRGGMKFMETAHIKDALAYLRVVQNPKDSLGWIRILPALDGIGIKTSQRLIQILLNAGNLPEGIRQLRMQKEKQIQPLLDLLESILDHSPATQVEKIVDYYFPIMKEKFDDYPKRLKDLDHLKALAERYLSLEHFLSELMLHPPEGSVADVDGEKEVEKMVLSTIHSAKGLEWRVVFVIWLLDGKFPSLYSFENQEELEEERRLFYVSITRAREQLYLSYPINIYDHRSGSVLSKPSSFLDTSSSGLLEEWTVVGEEA